MQMSILKTKCKIITCFLFFMLYIYVHETVYCGTQLMYFSSIFSNFKISFLVWFPLQSIAPVLSWLALLAWLFSSLQGMISLALMVWTKLGEVSEYLNVGYKDDNSWRSRLPFQYYYGIALVLTLSRLAPWQRGRPKIILRLQKNILVTFCLGNIRYTTQLKK